MRRAVFSMLGLSLLLGLALMGCQSKTASTTPAVSPAQAQNASDATADLPQFVPKMGLLPIVAQKSTKLAHRRACPLLKNVPYADKEYFIAYNLAAEQGYRPCPACHPDTP
jgi:hypothetical protein